MALVPCRECGKEISTEAPACPHCGRPTPPRTPSRPSPFRRPAASPSAAPSPTLLSRPVTAPATGSPRAVGGSPEDRILQTINRVARAAVIPLARAAVCLDCHAIFLVNGNCPACGSAQAAPVARWLPPLTP
jgi:RNA polymerase subunit RPABC4/transcription elongation factor Spt4